jgi:hypothetical protein
VIAQALVGNFFITIISAVFMTHDYGLKGRELASELEFDPRQEAPKRNRTERVFTAIFDRLWNAKRIKNIHLIAIGFASLGVAYIVCPKAILGDVDFCFSVAMFLIVGWRIVNSRARGESGVHSAFVGCVVLLAAVFVYGNYSLYRDAFYEPVYIELFKNGEPPQQYVLLKRFGEMILVLDPRTSRQSLVSDRGEPLLQFTEQLCDVSGMLAPFLRSLNKVRVPSCELDWARMGFDWKSLSVSYRVGP